MFLQEPDQTQYDVRFRLFDIPVRVHPFFWLVTVFLGFRTVQENPGLRGLFYLGMWVVLMFVSILVHELGHVCMGKIFGSDGRILLYGLGGLAIGSSDLPGRWQRIAVMFAGPLAGFLLMLAFLPIGCWVDSDLVLTVFRNLIGLRGPGYEPDTALWFVELTSQLIWFNLFWGLVNLLPLWPLDGGQISRELCTGYLAGNGMRVSLIISIVVAGAFAVYSLVSIFNKERIISFLPSLDLFGVFFFGFLAYGSWLMLQQVPRGGQYRVEEESYERAPWERDADWWKR
jgi:Zn-dependent protease